MPNTRNAISAVAYREDDVVCTDLLVELLASVVHFMVRSGMSRPAVAAGLRACVRRVKAGKTAKIVGKGRGIGGDPIAGAVLRAWHRLPDYLDEGAKPQSLRMSGEGPSLSKLILSAEPRANGSAVVDAMEKGGLVRRNSQGLFVARRDSATVSEMNPFVVNHAAKTLIRFVETLERNTNSSSARPPLIERYAYIPDLPKSQAKAFVEFSRQKGQAFLESMEDWLVARQPKSASRKVRKVQGATSAGVHVFAYLSSPPAKKTQRAPKTRRRTPTSARAATA